MIVACAAEGPYVAHSAAMLHSVIEHGTDVEIHFLHSPRTDPSALEGLGAPITFHEIADERVAGLPDDPLFTAAMWHRILLPELVDAPKVLYVDVDTLAVNSLDALWETSLGDAPVAAVTNVLQDNHVHHPGEIGLTAERYFNSGVLLLNLDRFRRDGLAQELRDVAVGRTLEWPDQDALNLVLGPERVDLHPRFNCMNSVYAFTRTANRMFRHRRRSQAVRSPVIRHFEGPGPNKPWHPDCTQPHRDEWRRHAEAAQRLTAIRPV